MSGHRFKAEKLARGRIGNLDPPARTDQEHGIGKVFEHHLRALRLVDLITVTRPQGLVSDSRIDGGADSQIVECRQGRDRGDGHDRFQEAQLAKQPEQHEHQAAQCRNCGCVTSPDADQRRVGSPFIAQVLVAFRPILGHEAANRAGASVSATRHLARFASK